jgi:hypothetical protein
VFGGSVLPRMKDLAIRSFPITKRRMI